MTTLEAGNAIKVAIALPSESLDSLSVTAKKLYLVLSLAAEKVKESRGYHHNTNHITFFCPLEIVALAVGVCKKTIYNRLPELVERGLVQQRGHFCTYRGQTRSDGSLWAIKLSPKTPGRAKIDYDWMKKQGYRNLSTDIQTGRTAYSLVTRSNQKEDKPVGIDCILSFAIIPGSRESNTYDRVKEISNLESLLDLPYVPLEGRGKAVDKTARAISASLGSPESSLMFWRWLLWNLLRLEQLEKSYFYQVFLIIQRASIERRENAAKNPAGLAVSWLKKSPIWDDLANIAPIRIGIKPKVLSG